MQSFVRMLCLIALLAQAVAVPNPHLTLDIKTAHTAENELKTKAAMEALERNHDLRPWTFTRFIMIDQSAIPHSHPILTIHTRHLGYDDALLATYLHEELHWFLEEHKAETEAAELALMKRYPSVPVGYPDGASDRESTYLHLLDCDLEWHADEALLGSERARKVMEYWASDHYRWVYKTVLTDRKIIDAILKARGLNEPNAMRSLP